MSVFRSPRFFSSKKVVKNTQPSRTLKDLEASGAAGDGVDDEEYILEERASVEVLEPTEERRSVELGERKSVTFSRSLGERPRDSLGERPSLEERVSLTKARTTGGKSLSELVTDSKSPGRSPRTPGGRFIKRQSSERTKIRIQKAQGATTVTLETAPVAAKDGTATPATAAPEEDALLERPSLSRADLLGGKPGHFARTHVKKVVADAAKPNVTIVVDGAGGDVVADSSLVKIKRKGLRPGLGRQGSLGARAAPRSTHAPPAAKVEGEASPASVTEDVAAKTEREKELEARLAVLEEQLSKTQCR